MSFIEKMTKTLTDGAVAGGFSTLFEKMWEKNKDAVTGHAVSIAEKKFQQHQEDEKMRHAIQTFVVELEATYPGIYKKFLEMTARRAERLPRTYGSREPYTYGDEDKVTKAFAGLFKNSSNGNYEEGKKVLAYIIFLPDRERDAAIEQLLDDSFGQYLKKFGSEVARFAKKVGMAIEEEGGSFLQTVTSDKVDLPKDITLKRLNTIIMLAKMNAETKNKINKEERGRRERQLRHLYTERQRLFNVVIP